MQGLKYFAATASFTRLMDTSNSGPLGNVTERYTVVAPDSQRATEKAAHYFADRHNLDPDSPGLKILVRPGPKACTYDPYEDRWFDARNDRWVL